MKLAAQVMMMMMETMQQEKLNEGLLLFHRHTGNFLPRLSEKKRKELRMPTGQLESFFSRSKKKVEKLILPIIKQRSFERR